MPSRYEALARGALAEITPVETIGDFVDEMSAVESDAGASVVSLRFETTQPGYRGWLWTVSVAHVDGVEPTVLEAELLPSEGALLAPEWLPWSDRLAEYKATQDAAEDGAPDGDNDGISLQRSEADDEDSAAEDEDDPDDDEDFADDESDDEDDDLDDDDDDGDDDLDDDDDDGELGSDVLHGGDLDGVDIDDLDDDDDDQEPASLER